MSGDFPYNPSAEELYSDYKQAYLDLKEAKSTLPEADTETTASINYMDSAVTVADIDIDTWQEFLTKITEARDISMKTRLRIQRINVIVAQHALGTEEIVSADVYARKKNEWHEEALLEDGLRSRQ